MSALRFTRAIAVCAAIACTALFAGASAATAAKKKCKPKNSTVLANDGYARVYGKNGNAVVCIERVCSDQLDQRRLAGAGGHLDGHR